MERIEQYDIDLKNLRDSSATYNYNVGDEFFKLIEATGIEKGNLEVSLTVKKGIGAFKLNFHIQGVVICICDRCLDEVEVDVDTDNVLNVKFGEEFSDDEDIVVVPEVEGKINVAWYIYEFAYLSLPYRIVHEEGECNEQMQEKLNDFMRYDSNDEGSSCSAEEGSDESETEEIDPSKMAHPKRRQSKTRTAKRRTHDKAVAPTLAICPNCGEWHVYHTVCGACGYYRGKLAIEKEAAL